jgi:general stress protein YciG
MTNKTGGRGFASMDSEKQRAIASKGGKASGGNFARDPRRASEAGRKGGQASGGNFAHDRERASEAGRKGGEASGSSRRSGEGRGKGSDEGE